MSEDGKTFRIKKPKGHVKGCICDTCQLLDEIAALTAKVEELEAIIKKSDRFRSSMVIENDELKKKVEELEKENDRLTHGYYPGGIKEKLAAVTERVEKLPRLLKKRGNNWVPLEEVLAILHAAGGEVKKPASKRG